MKIDIKDDNFLQLSCALSGAYGAHFLGWPAKAQDFHMAALEPKSNTVGRTLGLSLLQSTAITLVAAKADGAAKKDLMKVAGACWGASAINTAWGTHKGNLKEDRGWTNAAVQAGMAGLLLWRGTSNKSKV